MLGAAERLYSPATDLTASERAWLPRTELVLVRTHAQRAASSARARRMLNVAVAAVALLLVLPLMLVLALAVKLSSEGPVFYRQTRVGIDRRRGNGGNWRRRFDHGGKLFTIYKFRTMTVQTEAVESWAQPDDPRITPVGRLLRKYRLDELPQLLNVLRGDMNIVGPRPEQPRIFTSLREQIDGYQERQRVLPGITGWAQINQCYDRDLSDVRRKVNYDLEYAARVSPVEDLRIMLRTLPVVVLGKGAW